MTGHRESASDEAAQPAALALQEQRIPEPSQRPDSPWEESAQPHQPSFETTRSTPLYGPSDLQRVHGSDSNLHDLLRYGGPRNLCGPRVRNAREALGWDRKTLARQINPITPDPLSSQGILSLENCARRVTDIELSALAHVLEKTTDWLIGRSDRNPPSHDSSASPESDSRVERADRETRLPCTDHPASAVTARESSSRAVITEAQARYDLAVAACEGLTYTEVLEAFEPSQRHVVSSFIALELARHQLALVQEATGWVSDTEWRAAVEAQVREEVRLESEGVAAERDAALEQIAALERENRHLERSVRELERSVRIAVLAQRPNSSGRGEHRSARDRTRDPSGQRGDVPLGSASKRVAPPAFTPSEAAEVARQARIVVERLERAEGYRLEKRVLRALTGLQGNLGDAYRHLVSQGFIRDEGRAVYLIKRSAKR